MLKFIVLLAVAFLAYQLYTYVHQQQLYARLNFDNQNNDVHLQQLYARLNFDSPNARTYSREHVESTLRNAVDHCLSNHSQKYCEDENVCFLNKMMAAYTHQQITDGANASVTGQFPIPAITVDIASMATACGAQFSNE